MRQIAARCGGTAGRHTESRRHRLRHAGRPGARTFCGGSGDHARYTVRAGTAGVCMHLHGRRARRTDVEGVGRDLRNVDVVERRQIAGDDPAVLLERVRWPASFLHGHPPLGEVAEGNPRMRRLLLAQLDFPRARLALGIALPRGANGRGGPRRARERVSARVDPKLPATGRELPNAAIASPRYAAMPMDGTADGTPENDEGPGCSAGAVALPSTPPPQNGVRTRSPVPPTAGLRTSTPLSRRHRRASPCSGAFSRAKCSTVPMHHRV
jgi:hypothetical protein